MAACTSSFGSLSSSLHIALSVSGSGDAKMSASTIAFSSAPAFALGPSAGKPEASALFPTWPTCPTRPSCPSCPLPLLTMCLRIADRMRRIRRPCPFVHADRPKTVRLEHAHELQANHLEQREKRDDQPAALGHVREQIFEAARLGFRQAREQLLDARLDRDLLRRQQHLGPQLRALDDGLKRRQQAEEIDLELGLVFVERAKLRPKVL